MSDHEPSRLDMEVELLGAMYPEQATYDSKARELKFTQEGAILQLRLPESYPESGLPDVIAASNAAKTDIRTATKSAIKDSGLIDGEEALDAIIAAFQQVLESNITEQNINQSSSHRGHRGDTDSAKTVIIWLHHLLATSKRKLAISPSTLSGLTKPGYPGVMIFSGPSSAVTEHVNTLKAENWQAFQVRYEEDVLWEFGHGKGVKETETMGEMVKGVEGKTGQKEGFLKAVGIK
jgi:hypothetical protein